MISIYIYIYIYIYICVCVCVYVCIPLLVDIAVKYFHAMLGEIQMAKHGLMSQSYDLCAFSIYN